MAFHQAIHQAKQNGVSGYKHLKAGQWINASEVVNLLIMAAEVNRHPAVRRRSNFLIEEMAKSEWYVVAGPHKSGDQTMHITVDVLKNRYHLRQDSRGVIFEITDESREREVAPWEAPGSIRK